MSRDTLRENASGRQLKKQVDLTGGNPGKSLLMFAFPMILGNLFQQFYNMADSMIVGNFVGDRDIQGPIPSYVDTDPCSHCPGSHITVQPHVLPD